jgi:hypothetical protein
VRKLHSILSVSFSIAWHTSKRSCRRFIISRNGFLIRIFVNNAHSRSALSARLRALWVQARMCCRDSETTSRSECSSVGIVNFSGRGMLFLSVALRLGLGNSFSRLLCCSAQAERAGKRRSGSARLTMPKCYFIGQIRGSVGRTLEPYARCRPLYRSRCCRP